MTTEQTDIVHPSHRPEIYQSGAAGDPAYEYCATCGEGLTEDGPRGVGTVPTCYGSLPCPGVPIVVTIGEEQLYFAVVADLARWAADQASR